VASIAKSIDPRLVPEVQMMKTAFEGKLKTAEQSALAVSLLGAVALLLACAGIVGLVGYAVLQRTREIGIRMALGARPGNVLAVVLRQFSIPVAAGLAVGVGGAAALSNVLRFLLYGIGNLDPLAYLGAIAVFAVTVAVAALIPARRALRVDPMRALRYE
jgi:ABC-type antimicrobial peptide transport system permease subunit